MLRVALENARSTSARSAGYIATLLGSSALWLAPHMATAQDMMDIEDPSVSVIAFSGSTTSSLAGTIVDDLEFTNFELPQITNSGSVVFSGNQRFYVAAPSGTISTITEFGGTPFFNSTIGGSDLNIDELTGDVFFLDSSYAGYIEGEVGLPEEFERSFRIGAQTLRPDVRTLGGATAIVDDGAVIVRTSILLDFEPITFGTTSNTGLEGVANDIRFATQDLLIGSFSYSFSGSSLSQAIGVFDLDTETFAFTGPDFDLVNDQMFNGLTIPAGQFNSSSSLNAGSSNGDTLAFVIPVVENSAGNFARALATQTIARDPITGAVLSIQDGRSVVFGFISEPIDGVTLQTTTTTLGELVFLSSGPDLDPVVSENGDVIFFASTRSVGATDTVSGFWRLRDSDGVVEPVLIDGTMVSGIAESGTLALATIDFDGGRSFVNYNPQLTINADGQIAATVRIELPGEDDPVVAIIGQNVENDFFVVAHEGQQIDLGDDGGVRTVEISNAPNFGAGVSFVSGTLNGTTQINSNELDGVGDGFNVNSQLTFLVNFDDGSEAILRADLGAFGPPDVEVFRWAGGCSTTEWGTSCSLGGNVASNWVNDEDTSQIAADAPGVASGIQRAIITGADVMISESAVSITSLTTTDSTLTVSESLTLAEASSVDKLVVDGTVTSGSGPVTLKELELNGGTLSGAGSFVLVGEGTDDATLVTINAAESATTLNTTLQVTGGQIRLRENARLAIADGEFIDLREGAENTLSNVILANGVDISGGSIIFSGDAGLGTSFDGSSSGAATLSSELNYVDGGLSASNGTLTLSGPLSFDPDSTLSTQFSTFTGGRIVATGDISLLTTDVGGNATFDIRIEPGFALSKLVLSGSAVTATADRVGDLNIRDRSALIGSSDTRATSSSEATTLTPLVSLTNTTFTGIAVSLGVSTSASDSTFADGLSASNTTLQLSGNNTIGGTVFPTPTFDRNDYTDAYVIQLDGNTTFEGPGGLSLRGLTGTVLDVKAGTFKAGGARVQFGEPRFASTTASAIVRADAGANVIFGANTGASQTTIGLGQGRVLDLGQDDQSAFGAVLFENIMFADHSLANEGKAAAQIVNNLSGTDIASQGLTIRNAVIATEIALENNGNLLLDGVTGAISFGITNIGALGIAKNAVLATLENTEVGSVSFSEDVTLLSVSEFENNGDASLAASTELVIDGRLSGNDSSLFELGANASLTASDERFTTLLGSGEDGGLDRASLTGQWDLRGSAEVLLGEDRSITTITAGGSVLLDAGAKINDLSAASNALTSVLGELQVIDDLNIISDLTVGGVGAPDASLRAREITIGGDLFHRSGSINAGTNAINIDGRFESAGMVSAQSISATVADIQDGAAIVVEDKISVTTDLTVNGSLTSDLTTVASVFDTEVSIQADTLTIGAGGTVETARRINATTSIDNQGSLKANRVVTTDFSSGSGSTTDVRLFNATGDVFLGGTFTQSFFFDVETGRVLNNTRFEDTFRIFASDTLSIGTGVDLSEADIAADHLTLASRYTVPFLDGLSAPDGGQGSLLTVENGGVLVGRTMGVSVSERVRDFFGLEEAGDLHAVNFAQTIVNPGGRLEGFISFRGDLTNNGSVAPGASPGIIAVQGDYIQSAGATLDLEIGGTEPGQSDLLFVGGTATFDPASTINITLIDPDLADDMDEVFRPRTGDTFDILIANNVDVTGGEIGDIITITNGGESGTFMPTFMTVDGQLMLQLEALFGSRLVETSGLSIAQASIAGALDSISEIGDNDALTDFAVALDGLDDAQTGTALSQAGFSFASGLYDMGFAAIDASTGHITRHIDARIWTPKGTSAAAPEAQTNSRAISPNAAGFAGGMAFEEASQAAEMVASIGANQGFAMNGAQESRFGLIASGGYSFGSVDASLNQTGMRYSGGGGILGAEAALADSVIVGVSAGLTSLEGDTDNGLGALEATHYSIGAHAVAEAGPVVLDAQIGFGWLDMETDRQIAVGDVAANAQSENDGTTFAARARMSLPIEVGEGASNVVFGPSIELNAAKVRLDDLSETGAGDIGLSLSGQSQWRSNAAFALNAAATLELGTMTLTPRASVAYEVSLKRDSDAISAAFNGDPATRFLIPTDQIQKDRVKVLTAADLRLSRRMSASIAYQGTYGGDFKNQTVLAQARLNF